MQAAAAPTLAPHPTVPGKRAKPSRELSLTRMALTWVQTTGLVIPAKAGIQLDLPQTCRKGQNGFQLSPE
jgi:hypothetical protein